MLFFLGLAPVFAATALYVVVVIDPSGQLHITTKHHQEIVPKKEGEQTGFADAQISPDERAVGWLALYPNCCATYPIALKLVILVNGAQRTYSGNGLPISRWGFWAGGKQVAFEQETEHLADKYDPDANPDTISKPPRWVVVLDSKHPG
jgi:hypothetical protein